MYHCTGKRRVSGFYTRSVMLYDVASQVDGSRSGNLERLTNNLSRHVYFILREEHVIYYVRRFNLITSGSRFPR